MAEDNNISFDMEIAQMVCDAIEESSKGLQRICKAEQAFPSSREFHRWLEESEELSQRYARAKNRQADLLADQVVEIADDKERDPNCRRISIDARKWTAGKLKPEKYGDKIELDHKGGIKIVAVTSEDERL